MMAALKPLSDNSKYICNVCIKFYRLSFLIQFKIFLVLGIGIFFLCNLDILHVIWDSGSDINLLFQKDSSDNSEEKWELCLITASCW